MNIYVALDLIKRIIPMPSCYQNDAMKVILISNYNKITMTYVYKQNIKYKTIKTELKIKEINCTIIFSSKISKQKIVFIIFIELLLNEYIKKFKNTI